MKTPIESVCSKRYHATKSSGKRTDDQITMVVIHSEEAGTAQAAASWFENPKSGGSAHLCVDDDICYRTLDNSEIPWGAASSFGANTHGIHIEQAGFARWGSVEWLRHRDTIKRCAYKTALHCKAFDIPLVWLDTDDIVAQVRSGKKVAGITSHNNVSMASKKLDPANASRYDHTDPGVLYPRKYFMSWVKNYYDYLTSA